MTQKNLTILDLYDQLTPQNFDIRILPKSSLDHHQWSVQMTKEIIENCRLMIEDIVEETQDEISLLKEILPIIYDTLFLRGGISFVYNILKINLKKKKQYSSLTKMNFSNFLTLLLKMIEKKDLVGILLSFVRVPLPIYFETHQKPVQMIELVKGVIGVDKVSLIMNCGSKNTRKCGKTAFLFELFSIPTEYLYKEITGGQFYKNSAYVHKFFQTGKNNLIIDFNGSFDQMPDEISTLHKNCGLLIIHILESQLLNENKEYNGQQYFKKYQNIFTSAQKLLFIIRECQSLDSQVVQKSLKSLKNKLVFCLDKEIENHQIEQIAEKIQKVQLFKLKKTLDYFDILNDFSKKESMEKYYKDNSQIIKMLPPPQQVQKKEKKDNFIEGFFPHLFLQNKISHLKSVLLEKQFNLKFLSELEKKEGSKNISQIEKQIDANQKKLRNETVISKFVKRSFETRINGVQVPQKVQDFNKKLQFWKKEVEDPFLDQYLKITKAIAQLDPKNKEQLKESMLKKLEEIKEKLDIYNISSTTILNEVITNLEKRNEITQSQQQKSDRKIYQATINKIYAQAYQQMLPINLVDNKDLLFGDKYLKEFCKNLSLDKRFKNKKTYIISVIGAQSSGKSTLLNYLFRCQFQTSAGKRTKGMYFNICELDDKVIWLIDTEGLLSLNAKDPLFDNKIATFVLSISDIVIINNKGELTTQMRDMLEICTFPLKFLRKDVNIGTFKPQKLIFALQDQPMPIPGQRTQEQLISKIMKQLEKLNKLELNYKQYLDIQPEDIITLPSALSEADTKIKSLGPLEFYSETFGQCIIGLRSRIMGILDKLKGRRSLFDCYTECEYCWGTILKCGSDLTKYINYEDENAKNFIMNTYIELLPRFNEKIKQQFENFIQQLEQDRFILDSDDKEIQKYFFSRRNNIVEIFQEELKRNCYPLYPKQELYETFNNKISWLCQIKQNSYMDQFHRYLFKKRSSRNQENIIEEIKRLANTHSLGKEIDYDKDLKDLKTKSQTLFKNQLDYLQKNISKNQIMIALVLSQNFLNEQVGVNGTSWIQGYQNLIQKGDYQHMYELTYKLPGYQIGFLEKDDMLKFFKALLNEVKQMCQKNSKIKNLAQFKELQTEAESFDEFLKSTSSQYKERSFKKLSRKNVDILLLGYDKAQLRNVLRGCLVNTIHQIYTQKQRKTVLQAQKISQERIIDLIQGAKIAQEKANEKFKVQIELESLEWIRQIRKYYKSILKKSCEESLKNTLDSINISPETVLVKAVKQSFQSLLQGKKKWAQCFKLVMNLKKYLFQNLCKQQYIRNRKKNSREVLLKQRLQIAQNIKNQLITILKNNKQKSQSDIISTLETTYNSQKQLKPLTEKIYQAIKKHLEDTDFFKNWLNLIQLSVTNHELFTFMEEYVNNTLLPKAIGCESTCPFCEIKCMKKKDHGGQHETERFCHTLSCLSGMKTYPGAPCGSKQALSEQIFKSKDTKFQINFDRIELKAIPFVQKVASNWLTHFKAMQKKVASQPPAVDIDRVINYYQIWVNTHEMLAKYKQYPNISYYKRTNNPEVYLEDSDKHDDKYDKYQLDPLKEEDLKSKTWASVNLIGERLFLSTYVKPSK